MLALGCFGTVAKPAIPALIAVAGDTNINLRAQAIAALEIASIPRQQNRYPKKNEPPHSTQPGPWPSSPD